MLLGLNTFLLVLYITHRKFEPINKLYSYKYRTIKNLRNIYKNYLISWNCNPIRIKIHGCFCCDKLCKYNTSLNLVKKSSITSPTVMNYLRKCFKF